MAGEVFIEGKRLDKPGQLIHVDAIIEVRSSKFPWVSRGGVKLAHAIEYFGILPQNKVCLDIGASTGGFTDVLLENGASKVYSVDVGRAQLDWKLRSDERVIVLERTNARNLNSINVNEPIDIIVCDVSFIGLETVLPSPLSLAVEGATLVALIKPQFEVGRGQVGKGGVVRDSNLHKEVCERISSWLNKNGWEVNGLVESPILGPKGNREFLICAISRK